MTYRNLVLILAILFAMASAAGFWLYAIWRW